ncbi:MAG: sigma-70 family RNA polymerase sigma factor [Oligoflexia bacterium]|nr:sigma-70 family RNA polymerase sigma factor [Oligoflexia bacterium]
MDTSRPATQTATQAPPQAQLDIDKLVDEHYDYLFGYALRYFRSRDQVEDLVQETFLAVIEAVKSFEGNSSPRTWMIGILRNKIIDRLRLKCREAEGESIGFEQDLLSHLFDSVEHWISNVGPRVWGSCPEGALKQKQFFSTLEACLGKLPEKMRQIFLLRELDGYERDEICKTLKLSSSNVGVILHRSRLALQHCLQVNWFEEKKARGPQ